MAERTLWLLGQLSAGRPPGLPGKHSIPGATVAKRLHLRHYGLTMDTNPAQHLPPRVGNEKPSPTGRMPAYALLDNIRSVWNVGSIFRTADAVDLAGLCLCGMTATPPRPDMEKTALGATLTVPWDYVADSVAAARAFQDRGVSVIALEQTDHSADWQEFAYPFPHVFVVGHEVNGVRSEILDLADGVVEIPMAGSKHSLNVAVSFGVLAFAVRRRWLAGRQESVSR